MMKFGAAVMVPFLVACQIPGGDKSQQGVVEHAQNLGICGEPIPMGTGLELSVAGDYFEEERYRSALAYLEELNLDYVDARIMQADALRETGNLEASNALYLQLISSCLTARAYQGLALNAFEGGDRRLARQYMMQARGSSPTDAGIRNDLGYILLLEGSYTEAEQEFLTALELDRRHSAAAQNLALLYLYTEQVQRAEAVAQIYQIRPAAFEAIRNRVAFSSMTN